MKHVKEMKRPPIHSSVYPRVNRNRRNYAQRQYQCFQCSNPTQFKWDCPFYTCQTCDLFSPKHAPGAFQGCFHDDVIRGHYDIDGEYDGNLTGEC
jgi:hypothetical protein